MTEYKNDQSIVDGIIRRAIAYRADHACDDMDLVIPYQVGIYCPAIEVTVLFNQSSDPLAMITRQLIDRKVGIVLFNPGIVQDSSGLIRTESDLSRFISQASVIVATLNCLPKNGNDKLVVIG